MGEICVKNIINIITNGYILGIATLVGTLLGILGIIDSRKSKKELKKYDYLFSIAEKNIDKDLTTEELEQLHKQKEKIQQQLDRLNKVIKNDIPLEAQRTALLDRLKENEEHLVNSYNNYNNTKKEYEEISKIKTDIPTEILKEIELHIMPEYLVQKKIQKYMSMLTYISYASALLSIIPVGEVYGKFTIIFSIYPLIRIFIINLPKDKKKRKEYFKHIAYYATLIILGIYNLIIGIIVINFHYSQYNDYLLMVAVVTYPIFIIMVILESIKKSKKLKAILINLFKNGV